MLVKNFFPDKHIPFILVTFENYLNNFKVENRAQFIRLISGKTRSIFQKLLIEISLKHLNRYVI